MQSRLWCLRSIQARRQATNIKCSAELKSVRVSDQRTQFVFEPGAEGRAVFGAYVRTQRDA